MEYSYIFSIAGQVLRHLISPIFQELSSAWGLSDDLHRLENTVSSVQAVLLDAQERQENNIQLKVWLEKLENALYRAEDVLEEFEIDALRFKVCDRTILRKVRREFSRSNRIVFRFKMAHKIKKIRGEFNEIADDRIKFNLNERFDERVVIHRETTHSFVRDEDVIGRDKERVDVIRFLMATTEDESLSVLPIIGLGGIGKTTLAKFVNNDERVKAHFDLRIWVCISEEFELGKVIKEVLKSTGFKDCDGLSLEQLQKILREMLDNRKYLLILDDVWNENHTKWIELRNLLIGGANGSKIIITTRNESVASIMATTDLIIEVKGLSDDDSLSLFLKWAFRSSQDATRYPRLVEMAKSIVKKCKGVPLAMRTLGSILYTKTDEREWINVRDNEIWKIEQKEGDIMSALKLSYYQLPSNLRRCFAFCSMFPKDYDFLDLDLIHYWHANGLLQRVGENQDVEDVGMMYIKQLCSRGFFQDFYYFGGSVVFKMHDFVHDLALLVAGRSSLHLDAREARDGSHARVVVKHISFPENYFSTKEIPSWLSEQKDNVHAFTFPNGVGVSTTSFIETCISKFKALRLLDLRKSSFEVLPIFIGRLKHLKYLDLSSNTKIKALPTSICELVGLEVLHFHGCLNIEKIPKGLGQLIRLRSLRMSTKQQDFPEDEIRCLTSLQNLDICNCPNLKFVMSDDVVQCLTALRSLRIRYCESLLSLPERGLRQLTRLEFLSISNCKHLKFTTENETIENADGLRSLRSLLLSGLSQLESLPLCLFDGAINLKFLFIWECDNLTNILPERIIERLKLLKTIYIMQCPKLKSLPENFHCLTALSKIVIWNCPQLVSRCQRETGEDWQKIRHVPNIASKIRNCL